MLLEAAAKPDGALGQALATAIVVAADQTFKDVIGDAIRERDAIEAWIERAGSVDKAMAELSQTFGVDPDDTPEAVEQEFFSQSLIPAAEWPALIEILEAGSTNRQEAHRRARAAAQAAIGPRAHRQLSESVLHRRAGAAQEYRHQEDRRQASRLARAAASPSRSASASCSQRERALAARERTRALVTIAADVIARYAREKERRALLDYDDLIDKTLELFARSSAAWVLYKLDLGIDHVLIDEAQDTSPKQWSIVRTIVAEFIPGGARANVRRTVFAVGDEKQSIFSFQGAAPRAFDEMRREFAGQFDTPEQGWRYLRFHHSFRSGEAVLGGVDRVFARAKSLPASPPTSRRAAAHSRCPTPRPGWSSCGR